MNLEKIVNLYNSGRNKKALTRINEISDPGINILIFKSFILNRLSRNEEALEIINEVTESSLSYSEEEKFSALAARVRIIGVFGKSDWPLARKLIESAEDIFNQLTTITNIHLKRWRTELLFDKSYLFFMSKPDKKSILSNFTQCEILYKELGDQRGEVW